ncbi:tetratricopeptide repeat protein [Aliamphritea hakodatensis]|uniref:tetratricopeptide repeat protein n=1 Tax=Aliamphritea hakodatensis TaxID=2895352 RepID=UPI0022FD6953|nr:tetratricopeptide repeat protein [Aliamphritea hakodatensis]
MATQSGTLLKPLTLAISLGMACATSALAAQESDAFCLNSGAQNEFDCSKPGQQNTNSADINAKLDQLQRWLDNESAGKTASANNAVSAASQNAELQTKLEYNSQLLATELQRARDLQDAGKNTQAFNQINAYLNDNPKDANAWLLYGTALIKRNKLQAAEDVFNKLIGIYPDAPEAYNNLATIYALRGNNDKAVATLLQAFNTHPSYAQVQQNLKAIYANLANQAYNRALDLDSKEKIAPPQLATLDQVYLARPVGGNIFSPTNNVDPTLLASVSPVTAQAEPAPAPAPAPAADKPLEIEERLPEDAAPRPVIEAPVTATASQQTDTLTAPATPLPEPTAATTVALAKSAAQNNTELSPAIQQELNQALNGWARAWSDQNVQDYLSHYVSDYRPNSKTSNRTWRNTRNIRLSKPTFIRVGVSDVTMSALPDGRVRVVFLQDYTSNSFQDNIYKSLIFSRDNRSWKISAEKTL